MFAREIKKRDNELCYTELMKIEKDIPLAPYTTLKVGGRAAFFAVAKSEEDLKEALAYASAESLPFFILGGGSNLLVSDAGFSGLVIKMEMDGSSFEKKGGDVFVTAWAGESWDELVAQTVEWNLWGLENLSAIPGSVGAAPVQNIGAYGVEAMSVIHEVRAIDAETGQVKTFSNADCGFTYRESIFKRPESKRFVITSVTFKLSSKPKPILLYNDLKERFVSVTPSQNLQKEIREAVIAIRASKFPDYSVVGTAGSFWKNPIVPRAAFEELSKRYPGMPSFPAHATAGTRDVGQDDTEVKIPLAWILDKVCNLNGYSKGPVSLFQKQPLVLVAQTGATASQVETFAAHIKALVKEKTGIEIEREVGSL